MKDVMQKRFGWVGSVLFIVEIKLGQVKKALGLGGILYMKRQEVEEGSECGW